MVSIILALNLEHNRRNSVQCGIGGFEMAQVDGNSVVKHLEYNRTQCVQITDSWRSPWKDS